MQTITTKRTGTSDGHRPQPRAARSVGARRSGPDGRVGPASRGSGERTDTASYVRAAAAGDREAWEWIVERYQPLLMATARQAGMRSSDAADVCQVVWLRLFQHLDRLRQPERVGAWLRTTARREAIQVLVRSSREVSCEQERFDVVQLDARDVDAGLLDGERDVALRDALQALPPRTQRVLCLLAAEGSSYAAAAAELEVPIGSLGPTRARGLESLRRALPVSAPVSAIAS